MRIELPPIDGRKSFYGKCSVKLCPNGSKILRSYDTDVAEIDSGGHFKRLWSGYSATTMRHIRAFAMAYVCDFDGSKAAWDSAPIEQKEE